MPPASDRIRGCPREQNSQPQFRREGRAVREAVRSAHELRGQSIRCESNEFVGHVGDRDFAELGRTTSPLVRCSATAAMTHPVSRSRVWSSCSSIIHGGLRATRRVSLGLSRPIPREPLKWPDHPAPMLRDNGRSRGRFGDARADIIARSSFAASREFNHRAGQPHSRVAHTMPRHLQSARASALPDGHDTIRRGSSVRLARTCGQFG